MAGDGGVAGGTDRGGGGDAAQAAPGDQGRDMNGDTGRVLIEVENLCKRYKLYRRPMDRLIEWLSWGKTVRHQDFWALRDFSFKVSAGECVGIIGANGAGKSTLLRILGRTLSPTSGTFDVQGRALSLLELGTGFSPELSGRANVINTAQLLGLPEGYAQDRMADIEGFADLGEFLDRPIKTYSTGMVLRLAFSMFAFFEPDVLVVDEALAVGDVAFQRKCFRRMEELTSQSTRAVILVSHDLQSIVRLCKRVVWMDHGRMKMEGEPAAVTQEYVRWMFGEGPAATSPAATPDPHPSPPPEYQGRGKEENTVPGDGLLARGKKAFPSSGTPGEGEGGGSERASKIDPHPNPPPEYRRRGEEGSTVPVEGLLARGAAAIVYPSTGAELLGVWLECSTGRGATVRLDEGFSICYGLRFGIEIENPVFGIRVATTRGDCLISTNTHMQGVETGRFLVGETVIVKWPILPGLATGDYFISCGCSWPDETMRFLMRQVDAFQFSVSGAWRQSGLCSLNGQPIIGRPA
ncbi:MAG: ABC transporter ATP-binding protein [Tepidisphaeraceae bacterium]